MSSSRERPRRRAPAFDPWDPVLWQEVDYGSYQADLPLWRELADGADGPVLELGCGIGRVALWLARTNPTWAIDIDPVLVDEVRARAERKGATVRAGRADAAEFSIGQSFGLIIAPLHLAQELEPEGRRRMLTRCAAHLAPAGVLAATLIGPEEVAGPPGKLALNREVVPDMREFDGWVLSSRPLAVDRSPDAISVDRLREVVSPDGRHQTRVHTNRFNLVPPTRLEREAADIGLRAAARREVPATTAHLGSTVVILEARPHSRSRSR